MLPFEVPVCVRDGVCACVIYVIDEWCVETRRWSSHTFFFWSLVLGLFVSSVLPLPVAVVVRRAEVICSKPILLSMRMNRIACLLHTHTQQQFGFLPCQRGWVAVTHISHDTNYVQNVKCNLRTSNRQFHHRIRRPDNAELKNVIIPSPLSVDGHTM